LLPLVVADVVELILDSSNNSVEGKFSKSWLLEEANGEYLIGIFSPNSILPILEGFSQGMDSIPV